MDQRGHERRKEGSSGIHQWMKGELIYGKEKEKVEGFVSCVNLSEPVGSRGFRSESDLRARSLVVPRPVIVISLWLVLGGAAVTPGRTSTRAFLLLSVGPLSRRTGTSSSLSGKEETSPSFSDSLTDVRRSSNRKGKLILFGVQAQLLVGE